VQGGKIGLTESRCTRGSDRGLCAGKKGMCLRRFSLMETLACPRPSAGGQCKSSTGGWICSARTITDGGTDSRIAPGYTRAVREICPRFSSVFFQWGGGGAWGGFFFLPGGPPPGYAAAPDPVSTGWTLDDDALRALHADSPLVEWRGRDDDGFGFFRRLRAADTTLCWLIAQRITGCGLIWTSSAAIQSRPYWQEAPQRQGQLS